MDRTFPAKILLFGEYTVVIGSSALSVPFPHFSGRWKKGRSTHSGLIEDFLEFLKGLGEQEGLVHKLDIHAMRSDWDEGLNFDSDIPVGYGLGSSGAFSAAVFHRYGSVDSERYSTELDRTQSSLAAIESFFHGQSSGMDPLVSLLQQPLLVDGQKTFKPVKLESPFDKKEVACYLLNTKKSRRTEPLVRLFREKMKKPSYERSIEEKLKPLVEELILTTMGTEGKLLDRIFRLSELQLDLFAEMIPASLQAGWRFGLDKRYYALKLCGAGGGGYFLAFCAHGERDRLKKSMSSFDPLPVDL